MDIAWCQGEGFGTAETQDTGYESIRTIFGLKLVKNYKEASLEDLLLLKVCQRWLSTLSFSLDALGCSEKITRLISTIWIIWLIY